MRGALAYALAIAGLCLASAACGDEDRGTSHRPVDDGSPRAQLRADDRDDPHMTNGQDLFRRRCAGCHTLAAAGAQGAAIDAASREQRDGPNFDRRTVTEEDALFAIRNGGFGGDRMPANIVSGTDAEDVAAFVARYSGRNP